MDITDISNETVTLKHRQIVETNEASSHINFNYFQV